MGGGGFKTHNFEHEYEIFQICESGEVRSPIFGLVRFLERHPVYKFYPFVDFEPFASTRTQNLGW